MHTPSKVMKIKIQSTLQAFYLEWLNNWLTIGKFAAYHDMSEADAQTLIDLGRKFHEEIVAA